MRYLASLLVVLAVFSVQAAEVDPEVLALREAAWRAWFGGDEATLRAVLPAEFLGIDSSGAEINDLEKAIVSSRGFKEAGGKLLSLSFPETRAQQFGDTVILYGSYDATFALGGKETKMKGFLTEVFIKRGGKWVHPGWHLDLR